MRTILGCVAVFALALTAGAGQDDKGGAKIDPAKLVGKWEPSDAPKGAKVVIEMTKDGKASVTVEGGGKSLKMEGTYKLTGNKLTLTRKEEGKEETETMTITKLTDDELVTKDEKDRTETLKRIRDKK